MTKLDMMMCRIRQDLRKEMLFRTIVAVICLMAAAVTTVYFNVHVLASLLCAGVIYGVFFGIWVVRTDKLIWFNNLK